jgi:hypothetical protein
VRGGVAVVRIESVDTGVLVGLVALLGIYARIPDLFRLGSRVCTI